LYLPVNNHQFFIDKGSLKSHQFFIEWVYAACQRDPGKLPLPGSKIIFPNPCKNEYS